MVKSPTASLDIFEGEFLTPMKQQFLTASAATKRKTAQTLYIAMQAKVVSRESP